MSVRNIAREGRGAGRSIGLWLLLALVLCAAVPRIARAEAAPVRVGCYPLRGYFELAEDGTVGGYGGVYTQAVFEHAGLSYEYVMCESWTAAVEALRRGEIDLLSPAERTEERAAEFLFCAVPIGTEYGALLTGAHNDALVYGDAAAMDGLRVGYAASAVFGDTFEAYAARTGFTVSMTAYPDDASLLAALKGGEVDAVVDNLMVKTDEMKLLTRFGASPVYYMMNASQTALCALVDQVVDKISSQHPDFQSQLAEAYLKNDDEVPLSREELDYVASCGTLKVACGSAFPPFTYTDSQTGEVTGVGCDIFDEIGRATGLKFEYVPLPLTGDVQAFLKENDVRMVLGVQNDSDTPSLHTVGFTEHYLTITKYFFGHSGTELDTDAAMRVAVVNAAQAQLSVWQQLYPSFVFIRKNSAQECLDALHAGEADLILNDRYSMESLLNAPRNKDIRLLPEAGVDSLICCKVISTGDEEQDELLTEVLNKGIALVPESDKEKFISKHIQLTRFQYSFADIVYQYRWYILTAALVLAGGAAFLAFNAHVRRRTTAAIAQNEMKLRHITNNISGGVIVLRGDAQLEITYANDGFLDLIGCTRAQFEAERGSCLTYVHPEDVPKLRAAVQGEGQEFSLELRVSKRDGTYLPAMFNCTVGSVQGGGEALYCVIMDMSETYALLEQLRIENRRTELILDRVEEIFYEVDLVQGVITTSGSFHQRLGWDLPREIPKDMAGLLATWHLAEEDLGKLQDVTREMMATKKPVSATLRVDCRPQDRYVWCEVLQHPILSTDGTVAAVIGLIRDVDKQVAEREKLIAQAQHDPLTGLYNKEAFEEIVRETLARMPKVNHAVIFIDLDHFKTLNDTLGHMAGDRAIVEAADKLRVIFANYDVLARFGGDEFCVLVKDIPLETMRDKMNWLTQKLHADYRGPGGQVHITCSSGVAFTEQIGFDYAGLMQCADKALYYAKEQGRDRFAFYHEMPAEKI